MQSAARVLIVGHSEEIDNDVMDALCNSGFEGYTGDITHSAAELTGKRRPDVVILNMLSEEARRNPKAFIALARTLKESSLSSRMRVMLVGGDRDLGLNGATAEIDDILVGPVKASQICHRLKALVRLNTMHEELVRRLNTSAKYGVDAPAPAPPPLSIENATILFMGETKGFGAIEYALSKKTTLIGALTNSTAKDYLDRENFDSILIDAGSDTSSYLDFVRDLRQNSKLFNLPILMLTDPGALENPSEAYKAGVTDVLEKPVSAEELQVRTIALIREMRFRDTLRHIYTEAKHFATNDSLTGLYNRGFMLEHLANIIADTERTSQSFSIASFEIENMREINSQLGYAAGDRLIRQLGEMIGLLVRGEDLATRYSGEKFMIVLPDTSTDLAMHAIHRICGVVHNTEFAIQGHNAPLTIKLKSGVTGYRKGDTPETIVDRCWTKH